MHFSLAQFLLHSNEKAYHATGARKMKGENAAVELTNTNHIDEGSQQSDTKTTSIVTSTTESVINNTWNHAPIMENMKVADGAHLFSSADNTNIVRFAVNASWVVNWFLLGGKIFVVIYSSSKAVAASLADSAVDIVSQAVLSLAEKYIAIHSPNYPVGRSRLEALSVIACAAIMSMASVEVVQYSAVDIYNGLNGRLPELDIGIDMYSIFAAGIVAKLLLYLFCRYAVQLVPSDTVAALAEDHLNDVISNMAAIATAAIAFNTTAWWVDALGAIIISLVIIYRWIGIISDQVKKIVGHIAPPEFVEAVEELARQHDSRMRVDCTRSYHFGARYNVEMEVVLPGNMTVVESHDIALALQHKIESLGNVERAFVHVDHQVRDGLEHRVERELVLGDKSTVVMSEQAAARLAGTEEIRSIEGTDSSDQIDPEQPAITQPAQELRARTKQPHLQLHSNTSVRNILQSPLVQNNSSLSAASILSRTNINFNA